ncbi:MAG: BamA/TamA family outer membrane protein [Myxococcales bacterium]|jgi:translocation and assembly module TamA|nr:BamA/TamA family outer membrane protein [Myxococcales bacterium]
MGRCPSTTAIVAVTLCVFVPSITAAQEAVATSVVAPAPAPDPWVRRLDFEGNAHLSDAQLRAHIHTQGQSWIPFSGRHRFDEAAFETDLERIVRLYRANGFYQARILQFRVERTDREAEQAERPDPSKPGKVDVTISIDEGPRTHVAALAIVGIEALDEAERRALLKRFPLRVGAPMVESVFDESQAFLTAELRELGFAEAEVTHHARIFVEEAEADLAFHAQTGERFTIGALHITGLERAAEHIVLEQARAELPEGTRYSESALRAAEMRISGLGVFGSVRVRHGEADRARGQMPIDIRLREAPFRTLRLGAGIELDPKRQELPKLWGSWTHRDFFGGLRRFTASAEIALVFTGSLLHGLDRPRPAGNIELRFQQPALIGPDVWLDVTLGYERAIVERELSYDVALSRVGLPWRISRRLTFIPSFNFSLARFYLPAGIGALTGNDVDQQMALDACAREGALCRLAYLEQRLVYDRRDNPLATTRGFWLGISLQEGSRFLGGGYGYVRVLPEARGYVPIGPLVVAMRVMAGLLHTFDDDASSSVLTRFFLGGASSQRGFSGQQLSPRLALPDDVSDSGQISDAHAIAIGGNAMILGNLELRVPLPAGFGIIAFCDAGEVMLEPSDLRLDALQIAVGLGLRYQTVFGPIRLDFGFRVTRPPLQVEALDESGPVRLVDVPRFSLLLNLGEAF